MNIPLFSILIAQYNNGKYFQDCYKSIIAQTYQNWEVIIVDDCSIDDSVKQMKAIIGDDARFKIFVNEENKGCGFTKRRCAELAKGEICGFLDPDDAITKSAIEVMINTHINFPDSALAYSNSNICDEYLHITRSRKVEQVINKDILFLNKGVNIFHFVTFRSNLYKKTEGIDPYLKRAVDQDLYLKLYEVGDVVYVDQYLYNYRIHDNGISTLGNTNLANYWYWVVAIQTARRRNINIENQFVTDVIVGERQKALEKEIAGYNKSLIFKILRKFNIFKL